jgi:hypothetical protein
VSGPDPDTAAGVSNRDLGNTWRFPEVMLRQIPSPTANSSLSRITFKRFEGRRQWLPVGSDCVAQQLNQRPAIVLGQVEGTFCGQRATTSHRKHYFNISPASD